MKRTDRVSWGGLKVGLLAAFGIFVLLWASFSGGTSIFSTKKTLHTMVTTAVGLMPGAPVRLSGVEVGKVTSVTLVGKSTTEQVDVQMTIEEGAWALIKSDSKATLGTIGMLGDKYIEITPGTPGLPNLSEGDYIPGQSTGDLLTLMDEVPEIMGNIRDLSRALAKLARHLDGSEGTLGKLLYSDSLYNLMLGAGEQASDIASTLKKDLPQLSSNLRETLERINALADAMQDTSGTLGMVLSSRTLYDRIDHISANLASLTDSLRAGKGTAGALLSDETMYADLHKTILDLQNLLTDMRANPKKYVTFKIF